MAPKRKRVGVRASGVHQSVELEMQLNNRRDKRPKFNLLRSSGPIRVTVIVERILNKMRFDPGCFVYMSKGIIDFIIDLNQCLPR